MTFRINKQYFVHGNERGFCGYVHLANIKIKCGCFVKLHMNIGELSQNQH